MFQLIICALMLLAGCVTANVESQLRADLLKDYDKTALPNTLTNVTVRFTVMQIDLDEVKQSFILDGWIAMEWKEPRLKWDPAYYENISVLSFPTSQVWRPDLTLYNNDQMEVFDHMTATEILAMPSGDALTVPTAHLPASCLLDMTYWPNDVHNCSLKMGSWVHSGHVIDLLPKDDGAEVEFEMEDKSENGLPLGKGIWEVLSTRMTRNVRYYPCCAEPYVDIRLEFIVRRVAPLFTWTVKVPFVVLSLLTGALFLLPPGSLEKVVMGTLIIILDFQFISYITDTVKSSAAHTPLIVQYSSELLVLTLTCVFISVLIVRMVRDPHSSSLPSCLQRPMSVLGKCCCLSGYRKQVSEAVDGSYPRSLKGGELELGEDRKMVGGTSKMGSEQAEWLLLGALLDRVFLVLYAIDVIRHLVKYNNLF